MKVSESSVTALLFLKNLQGNFAVSNNPKCIREADCIFMADELDSSDIMIKKLWDVPECNEGTYSASINFQVFIRYYYFE